MSRQPRAGTPAVSINFFFSSIETIFLSRTCHPSQRVSATLETVTKDTLVKLVLGTTCFFGNPFWEELHASGARAAAVPAARCVSWLAPHQKVSCVRRSPASPKPR